MESVIQQKLKITVMMPKFMPAYVAKLKVYTTRQNPANLQKLIIVTPNTFFQSTVLSSSLKNIEISLDQKKPWIILFLMKFRPYTSINKKKDGILT